jgi:hypothetical protein
MLAESGTPLDQTSAVPILLEVASLMGTPPDAEGMLHTDRSLRAEFDQRHQPMWSEPVASLRSLCLWAEGYGAELAEHEALVKAKGEGLLIGLLASSCAATSSVWWSLTGGYAMAAEGTVRTLIELAVTTRLLARNINNSEIIERYNASLAVAMYKVARAEHLSYEDLGRPPPDPTEVEKVLAELAALKEKYQETFVQGLWWARPVCPDVSLPGAAQHVGFNRYRAFTTLSNQAIHADRASLHNRQVRDEGGVYWLSGASSAGIGRPGATAATLLGLICADVGKVVLEASHPETWSYGVMGNAIHSYSNRVSEQFADREAQLEGDGHGHLA